MTKRLAISDHALVRYLERVGGFEIECLREQLAARLQPFVADTRGAVIIDGHAYVIERNQHTGPVLVTVIPAGVRQRILKAEGR